MANALTGDFDAIVQVSGGTLNRLLASMHQNAFVNPNLPSFPHSVQMRIGDDHDFEGVRGLAHAQVSTPRIELIHGATDRFRLQVSVRAWYRPDPGTTPLSAYINGTVKAEYRLHDVDPSCPGWSKDAADTLWFRVERDSVTFSGTVEDDIDPLSVIVIASTGDPAAEEAAMKARVTRQIARLLAKRFEATPHKLSPRFRRGSMRSLNHVETGSAIVIPIDPNGGDPWGNIASVDSVLLNGADVAVAIRVEYIMGLAQQMVQPFASFALTIPIHIGTPWPAPDINTVYRVGVHPPQISWIPQGNYSIIKIKISGWANTDSILANASFDIDQDVTLNFNGGFWLAPGSATVTVHTSGLYHGTVNSVVNAQIKNILPTIVQNACNAANPSLGKLTSQTGELQDRLRSLDAAVSVSLDWAEFLNEGVVVRGPISVSHRKAPVVQHEIVSAGNAHSALQSWIPGGRIDRFEWTWSWAASGETGSRKFNDRFLLQRPRSNAGRWGIAIGGKDPLPGLDGWGKVCLRIIGVTTDPVTGDLVTTISEQRCRTFGQIIAVLVSDDSTYKRLMLRDIPEWRKETPFPNFKDRGLVALGRNASRAGATNTLVVLVDGKRGRDAAKMVGGGLDACRRFDAGLAVLVLFREGELDRIGHEVAIEMAQELREQGIPAQINEDVQGTWGEALGLKEQSEGLAWALITPEGTVPWNHRGTIEAETLGGALDQHLRRVADNKPVPQSSHLQVGTRLSAADLTLSIGDLLDLTDSPCPPIPFGRLATKDTVFAFVHAHSDASMANLQNVLKNNASEGTTVVAIVEGAGHERAQSLQRQRGLDVVAIPDPDGKVSARFGIDVWPTTVVVSPDGVVSEVMVGLGAHDISNRAPEPARGRSTR
jgi:hypothetical protein